MSKVGIGDTVWIAGIAPYLTEGKVVHSFILPDNALTQYVIEVPTPIDPLYEVRNWYTISLTKEGPLNLWKVSEETKAAINRLRAREK